MDVESVLRRGEELGYHDRMKYMVELGRMSVFQVQAREVIKKLLHGSLYEQLLGLQSCYGRRDIAPAMKALSSPSRVLKTLAMGIVLHLGTDMEILHALESIPQYLQLAAVGLLRRRRKVFIIDEFLSGLKAEGDDADLFEKIFPLGSEATVEQRLHEIIDRFGEVGWRRLLKFHPKLAYTAIAAREENPIDRLLAIINCHFLGSVVTKADTDMALKLVNVMLRKVSLSQLYMQKLAKKRPCEVAQLVIESNEKSTVSFSEVGKLLESRQLLSLYERYPDTFSKDDLRKLTPEQRAEVYYLARGSWRNKDGILPLDVVSTLPTKERLAEARRHLLLPVFKAKPSEKIPYIALLPWDEAIMLQQPFLRFNDADIRALAVCSQITATNYQQAHLVDALQLVIERRFEQDPVRNRIISTLANVPPGRWKEGHLSFLEQVTRHALDASDLSFSSVYALLSLVTKLLLFHPEWASKQLAQIIRERRQIPIPINICGYSQVKKTMRLIATALLPVLGIFEKKQDEEMLVMLARAFRPHIRYFSELLDTIERVLLKTRVQRYAQDFFQIVYTHRPKQLEALVPRLIESDPTFVALPIIRDYIVRRQQYLITPYLVLREYEGAFKQLISNKVVSIDGYFRLTYKQQEIFANTLAKVIRNTDSGFHECVACLKQLAGLCFLDGSHIIPFAWDERPVVRDEALKALSKLDAGQGFLTLLEALEDDRARVAIYALCRVLRKMPRTEVLRILSTTSMTKVTVAKEVIRLMSEIKSEDAYQYLLRTEKTNLHSNVRTALLRSLWSYVERPEPWEILKRAAKDQNPSIPKALTDLQVDRMSARVQGLYVSLFADILRHKQAEVRFQAMENCSRLPFGDSEHLLTDQIWILLQSPIPDERSSAIRAFFSRYYLYKPDLIAQAFCTLLKKREALLYALNIYVQYLSIYFNLTRMLPATRSILGVLKEDPLTLSLRLKLSFHGLPMDELYTELLAMLPELHADALVQAEELTEKLAERADFRLSELEQTLLNSNDERLRRLALSALLGQSRQTNGWTKQLRERLLGYQTDKSLLVAEAATFIFPTFSDE